MLIAIMSDTYNSVQDSAITAANLEISQLVHNREDATAVGAMTRTPLRRVSLADLLRSVPWGTGPTGWYFSVGDY